MKEFLSHYSAAYKWEVPFLDEVLGAEHRSKCFCNKTESKITHITMTNPGSRYNSKNRITYSCQKSIPANALIKRSNYYIASPEFTFLQLANELDILRLIFLGLQMCSHPPGEASKAISSKQKIKKFLQKTSGFQGHPKAKRAVKYIENGSASIMESIVFMILTLPNILGGFGLKNASFNQEVIFAEEVMGKVKEKRFFMDLFYTKEKVAVEYDSFKHHHTPESQGKDLLRMNALELYGIDVIRLSTIQLYNRESCEVFVKNLASRLGKRIRIRTPEFEAAHKNLRKLLPTKE